MEVRCGLVRLEYKNFFFQAEDGIRDSPVTGVQTCALPIYNSIFFNVKKIPDEKELENTIVHELIHHRFPYLSHGKRFNKLVRQGLKGKTFPPYRKRK